MLLAVIMYFIGTNTCIEILKNHFLPQSILQIYSSKDVCYSVLNDKSPCLPGKIS